MAKQTIGEFLSALRRAHGYTQQEVADKLGISNRTLSAWERDTSAPDILLLPVLADLYGVTVDEILRGERRAAEEPKISNSSKTILFKNRLARFTMQAYILTGIFCLGLILFFVGWFTDVVTTVWVGWEWWLLLLWLGLTVAIICAATLIALWKGAELFADDENEKYGAYVILLRRQVTFSAYFGAALSFAFSLFATVTLWERRFYLPFVFVFFPLAVVLYLCGFALSRRSLKKWGGDEVQGRLKRDARRMQKLALFGLIPLVLAIVCIWVTNVFTFPAGSRVIYENDDRDAFIRYMETIQLDIFSFGDLEFAPDEGFMYSGEYCLALSEHAKTAKPNETVDLGNGFTVRYSEDKEWAYIEYPFYHEEGNVFTNRISVLRQWSRNKQFSVYFMRNFMRDRPAFSNPVPLFADYLGSNREIVEQGEGAAYIVEFRSSYETLGRVVGAATVVLDAIACIAVFHATKERIKIKL